MKINWRIIPSFLIVLLWICLPLETYGVRPNTLFSDGVVLQQGVKLPIWGSANDGEKVTVTFQDQTVSTTAREGHWIVHLKPLKAGGPFVMTIAGENIVTI